MEAQEFNEGILARERSVQIEERETGHNFKRLKIGSGIDLITHITQRQRPKA